MKNPIVELIREQQIEDCDLEEELYEICSTVHASCNSDCPVFELNGGKVPDTANDFEINRGCDCFKSGKAMLRFIREMI